MRIKYTRGYLTCARENLLIIFTFFVSTYSVVGQNITADMFTSPTNTGANMTVGVNASKFDQFVDGQIGAFYDLNGDGALQCVGLESIATGFFGLALWGDDSDTPDKDGLELGESPVFAVLHDGNVFLVNDTYQFTGYVTNGIVNLTYVNLLYNGCENPNFLEYYITMGLSDFYDYLEVEQTNLNCETLVTDADIDPEDFTDPVNTGANMTMVVPEGLNQFVGGVLGAFYESENGFVCVGLEYINSGFFGIALWGDDSSTPQKDGLLSNEIPLFAVLYNGVVIAVSFDSEFNGYVQNGIESIESYEIYSPPGCLNPLACNYSPLSIRDDGSCIVPNPYYDCLGTCINDSDQDGVCDELEIPGCTNNDYMSYNNLATDNDGSCLVTFKSAFEALLHTPIYIDIQEGWNMIGYSHHNERDAQEAMSDIVENLIIIKDNNANFYMPQYDFNGLGNLIPGQGYQLKVTQSYPDFTFHQVLTLGCMDTTMYNYNSEANFDANLCTPFIYGCTDSTMFNYDKLANTDDSSCYPYIEGCMDSTAFNFIPHTGNVYVDVNTDDGSCVPYIYGCTYVQSYNYNSMANVDDGSCIPLIYGMYKEQISPSMFTTPTNTGANMTVGVNASKFDQFEDGQIGAFYDLNGDGALQCVGVESIATGFFGLALWGDDSSTPDKDGLGSGESPVFAILHDGNVILVDEIPEFTGYVTNGIVNISDANLFGVEDGCSDDAACNTMVMYSDVTYFDDGSCTYAATNYDCTGNCLNDADGDIVCDEDEVAGCQDASACNYNSLATDSDGSCNYPQTYYDCAGQCISDIDSDGVCDELEIEECNIGQVEDCFGNCAPLSWIGDGICDDGSYTSNGNPIHFNCVDFGNDGNDCSHDILIINGCMDPTAYNYDPNATIDNGTCEPIIIGCTDIEALNYDEMANMDDGSCIPVIIGCMDYFSCNYDTLYNVMDSTLCTYADTYFDCSGNFLHQVGDEFQGGILFHIDTAGFGLIASKEDVSVDAFKWGCIWEEIGGAFANELGTGNQNTLNIVGQCDEIPIAAKASSSFSYENYNDWYLPSIDELELMINTVGHVDATHGNVINLEGSFYWSSTQVDAQFAKRMNSVSRISLNDSKSNLNRVRAIRMVSFN